MGVLYISIFVSNSKGSVVPDAEVSLEVSISIFEVDRGHKRLFGDGKNTCLMAGLTGSIWIFIC